MVSVRVTRDRRGYDHIYLIEENRRRGRPEGRLLYWSRSPGGVRVGRDLFDADTRLAIERANPGITFDWTGLLKSALASAAAARWNARQSAPPHGRPPGPPLPSPRTDRARSAGQSRGRTWREAPRPSPAAEGQLDDAPGESTGQSPAELADDQAFQTPRDDPDPGETAGAEAATAPDASATEDDLPRDSPPRHGPPTS